MDNFLSTITLVVIAAALAFLAVTSFIMLVVLVLQ